MARRRNQGGPSLLIPMIIAGFAWIGMVGLAFYLHSGIYGKTDGQETGIIYGLYEKEKDLKRYQVLVDRNDMEHTKLTKLIGFTGSTDNSDSTSITFQSELLKNEKYDVFEANYTQPVEWGVDDDATYPFKIEDDYQSGNLTYKSVFPYADFAEKQNPPLKDIILAQDNFINKVLEANNTLYNAILGLIQDYNKAYRSESQNTMNKHKKVREDLDAKDDELRTKAEADDQATKVRDKQLDELMRTYNELLTIRTNIAEIKKELEKDMIEQDELERKVEEIREKVKTIAGEYVSIATQKNEYDGAIFYVSKGDRWAYINLGSRDHILDNMTFNIIRYEDNGKHQRIGILQVKKVMTERTSQCVITNIINNDLFPEPGDKIRSMSYTNRQVKSFGFLGYFGGEFSKYSRDQMKGFLEKRGFRVDDEIVYDTEVIILGFDYENDPYYKYIFKKPPQVSAGEWIDPRHELYKSRTTFGFMRPEEVEHLLGMNK